MNKVLILGLGNDLLTDDAVGLRVVHEVRSRVAGDPRIHVHETTEMGLGLLDLVTGYESLVIVDSIQSGEHPPGFVHEIESGHLGVHATRTPHATGVEHLCSLGRVRRLPVPHQIRVVAVEVGDPFTFGNEMTPEVVDAIDDAADLVVQRALEFAELQPARSAD